MREAQKGAALGVADCLLPAHHRTNLLVGSLDSTLGFRQQDLGGP